MEHKVPEDKSEIVIYRDTRGQAAIDVILRDNTVWLTQKQISNLFQIERSVITKHIRNVIQSKELEKDSVRAKFAHTAEDGKTYRTTFYNLDMILSVGYRVNSKRGTQFRIWATNVLRDHLVKGYTLNEKRLRENKQGFKELEDAVTLIEQAKSQKLLSVTEASGLLTVITEYTRSWLLLHQYDSDTLRIKKLRRTTQYRIDEKTAKRAIVALKQNLLKKREAGDLFGIERERGVLEGILAGIDQTFDGNELYPEVEEKAAHLLYFIIKDHPFVDGNKRIASLLFIWFLEKNGALSNSNGERKINDSALVALALLVAESAPRQKDVLVKLIINLLNN